MTNHNNLINLKEVSKALGYRTNRVLAALSTAKLKAFAVRQGRCIAVPLEVLCDAVINDCYIKKIKKFDELKKALAPFVQNPQATLEEVLRRIKYIINQYDHAEVIAATLNKTFAKEVLIKRPPLVYKTESGRIGKINQDYTKIINFKWPQNVVKQLAV